MMYILSKQGRWHEARKQVILFLTRALTMIFFIQNVPVKSIDENFLHLFGWCHVIQMKKRDIVNKRDFFVDRIFIGPEYIISLSGDVLQDCITRHQTGCLQIYFFFFCFIEVYKKRYFLTQIVIQIDHCDYRREVCP